MMMMTTAKLCLATVALLQAAGLVFALSTPGADSSALPNLFDRFRVVCPADIGSIAQYDSNLIKDGQVDDDNNKKSIWAAVYRSNNNKPSVMVRDELLQSMRLAVDSATTDSLSNADNEQSMMIETPMAQQKPVAIACLRQSENTEGCWVMDTLRCDLKKENTDDACDGGSEHTEAVSSAIDALILQYLLSSSSSDDTAVRFEGVIQAKATLVSGILLEDRGFVPVESLTRDMTTHTSSLDTCLEKYAERAVNTKTPAARERALQILSHLGRLNREDDILAAKERMGDNDENRDESDNEYDPWASVKNLL